MATIASLLIGAELDTTKLDAGVGRMTSTLRSFGQQLGVVSGVAGLAAGLGRATSIAADFSGQMAEIATLLPKGAASVDDLTKTINKLSLEFGKAPQQQAAALYEIISAGASSAAQATEILAAANKLAVGGVADLKSVADGLTNVIANYGESAGTATQISDTFFVAAAAGKTRIEELSRSIGSVAPLASEMGVSLAEVTSATAALTKGGVSTEVAMRGIRAILATVLKPSSEAAKEAARLGLAFNAAAIQSKGLAGFLADLSAKTKGSTESMGLLFGPVEALVPALSLTGKAAKDLNDILAATATGAGSVERAFNIIDTDSAAQKFAKLQAALQVGIIAVGDKVLNVLVPAVVSMTDNLDAVVPAVKAVTEAIAVGGLIVAITNVSTAMAFIAKSGFGIAILNIADAFTSARAAGYGFAASLGAVNASLGTMIGLVVGSLGLVAALAAFAKALFDINRATQTAKTLNDEFAGSVGKLTIEQNHAAQAALRLAIAQTQVAAAAQLDPAAGPLRFVEAMKSKQTALANVIRLTKDLQALERANDSKLPRLPGVFVTAVKPPPVVTRAGDVAGSTGAAEAVASALAKTISSLQSGVQNIRTNFAAVANEQVVLTGLGEEYLTLTQQITVALAQQRDALGSTATTLRGMLLDLRNVFSPDLSELTKKIEESFRDAIANSGAAKIMAAVLTPASLGSSLTIRNGVEAASNATIRSFGQLRGALATFANALRSVANTAKDAFRQQFAQFGAFAKSPQEAAGLFVILPFINGLFETLGPTLAALQEPLRVLGTIVGSALVPILRILFPVFKGVAIAATYVGEVFFKVSAFILRAIGSLVRGLGNLINKLPGSPGDPLVKAGQGLLDLADSFTAGANELAKGRDELRKLEFGGAAEALNKTAEAANALTDSLLNVPSGFKIAAAVFAATLPVITGAASIPSAPVPSIPFNIPAPSFPSRPPSIPAGGGGGGGMIIEAGAIVINGVNKSQREVAKEVIAALRQEGYEQFGDSSRWPETV